MMQEYLIFHRRQIEVQCFILSCLLPKDYYYSKTNINQRYFIFFILFIEVFFLMITFILFLKIENYKTYITKSDMKKKAANKSEKAYVPNFAGSIGGEYGVLIPSSANST